ncbi:hypothetical protein NLI96_g10649 [Meripilus lineatus]|uniref:F-box domain-containing protein n=1 Tax=Meripilus lineatus TaxID=2056292 RepID=A0AAD5UT75_9APHY|nr:hypothetical protein NLI96_g10649 [Physisporinus lineatus]
MAKPGIRHQIRALPPKLLLCFPRHEATRQPEVPIDLIILPGEILLHILSYLTQDSFDESNKTFVHLAPQYIDESFRRPPVPRRSIDTCALFQIALVCRSWYTRVIWYLYQHPILVTFDQIRLFRRTVEHCAHLAQLVKTISIMTRPSSSSSYHA